MRVNFELTIPEGREADFLNAIAAVFGPDAPKLREEKAVKPSIPADVAEEAEPKKTPPKEKTSKKSKYSITSVRAKAKEVSAVKGKEFIREALKHVDASSISAISEDRFEDFMDYITQDE